MIKTKAAIREAFLSLMMERDTPRITITEIAQRANIDRKTFYLHYDSTAAIINELSRERVAELLRILEQDGLLTRAFDTAALFRSLNLLMEKDIDLYRHMARTPAYAFLWEQIKDILKGILTEVLADRVDASPGEFALYAEFYSAGTIAAYLKWLREEVAVSDQELAAAVGNAAYYGFQKLLPQED